MMLPLPVHLSWGGELRLARLVLFPLQVTVVFMGKHFSFRFTRSENMTSKIKVLVSECIVHSVAASYVTFEVTDSSSLSCISAHVGTRFISSWIILAGFSKHLYKVLFFFFAFVLCTFCKKKKSPSISVEENLTLS